MNLRRDALSIFRAALDASEAGNAVRRSWRKAAAGIQWKAFDRVFLIAAGKAAVPMAAAVEQCAGRRLTRGTVVTKYGHATGRLIRCEIIEAAHPVPDEAGVAASARVLQMLSELNARDLLIVALSGGASALLTAPAVGITLAEKQQVTELLLRAGANIGELNAVRKHLSLLKGGQLARRAYPATVLGLILSDVIGDPLDVIASGPTAPDPATFADAAAVLRRFGLWDRVSAAVRDHLMREIQETVKPRDPVFWHVQNFVVGSNLGALQAAKRKAQSLGYRTLILSSTFMGEARDLGNVHASILREMSTSGNPVRSPACILSGGESTVTVRGSGKGGRAQELALAAAMQMKSLRDCLLLSAGTDGSDGPTDAAGAIATPDTVRRAAKLGFDAADHLARNDAYSFFSAAGGLVKTGPTSTNVMDVVILLSSER